MELLFSYKLKPIEQCAVGEKEYCWHYLSDSFFYFQLGSEKIFEYTTDFSAKYPKEFAESRYADYYFDQIFSDLLVIGRETLSPIPQHIFRYIDTFQKYDLKYRKYLTICRQDIDDLLNDYINENLFFLGGLDTGYFVNSPRLQFFHVEDKMIIQYDCTQLFNKKAKKKIWTAGKGTIILSYKDCINQLEILANSFLKDMEKQVSDADSFLKKVGIVSIHTPNLIDESRQRRQSYLKSLVEIKNGAEDTPSVDWDKIEAVLKKL